MKAEQFIQKAVALKYDANINSAPVVKSKGIGKIAEKIIQIAKENNIPIKENPNLVELLIKIDLEKEIPPELYRIVAEVLAFIYRLNRRKSQIRIGGSDLL